MPACDRRVRICRNPDVVSRLVGSCRAVFSAGREDAVAGAPFKFMRAAPKRSCDRGHGFPATRWWSMPSMTGVQRGLVLAGDVVVLGEPDQFIRQELQGPTGRTQCLDRRIESQHHLISETAAWERQRNNSRARARIKWMFTTEKAPAKMGRAYPKLSAKESNHCDVVLVADRKIDARSQTRQPQTHIRTCSSNPRIRA
jgi:hypothetical protein